VFWPGVWHPDRAAVAARFFLPIPTVG
jgi:hypothetical protein